MASFLTPLRSSSALLRATASCSVMPLRRPTTMNTQFAASTLKSNMGFTYSSVRFISGKRYSTDHEYVILDKETNIGTVGITDYAQKALGDVVFVELPAVDVEVAQGDGIGAVESVKAASDIYAPLSGTVVEINEALNDQANLLNKSPEDKGWLCKIKLTEPEQFEELLSEDAYKAHCEGQ